MFGSTWRDFSTLTNFAPSLQPQLVPGDDEGLLPSPSIMVESMDRFSAMVGWQLSRDLDPQYKLQLFVVNVVGTKFSSKINSDIR